MAIDQTSSAKKVKDSRIVEEEARLRAILVNIPDNQKVVVEGLILQAAYTYVALDDLQEKLSQHSGNGIGMKVPPEFHMYDNTTRLHMDLIKQLTDLLKRV